jgi:hypothetical protein
MRNIPDKLLATASLISADSSSGSGIPYATEKGVYLVTAKHVIFDKNDRLYSDEIEVVNLSTELSDKTVFRFRIDLTKARIHSHPKNDICIIRTGKKIGNEQEDIKIEIGDGVEILERSVNTPGIAFFKDTLGINEVLVSNNIFVLGYPTSIGLKHIPQFDYNAPLLRKGVIAGINKSENTIILDCATYGGNSGGPVIQESWDGNKKVFNLIGVVSQYIPYVQKWYNRRDGLENKEYLNSGYSVATAWNSVVEIIEEMEKEE